MKRLVLLLSVVTLIVTCFALNGCQKCDHDWQDATCTVPKTCSVCNATEGTALGHSWANATCVAPKTCTDCNATEGTALGHSWINATCTAPKTCSVCNATDGEPNGHTWIDATATSPKTCSICNTTEGEALGYTVTFDLGYGGETFTQTVAHGEKAEEPDTPVRDGYVFTGWGYKNGTSYENWVFYGYTVTSDITLVAQWDYATYELPIINISTDGVGITSKEDYVDMSFTMENCDEELEDVVGGIRLRGNSTLAFPKKAYRIKFDKKQSLFGLEKAKSWVLLAEYVDPSALHNYTAMQLADQMPGLEFTPSPHKINLYLNGEFLGLYTLCEQVQENKGRIDIELDEITEDMVDLKDYNFFICMDYSAKDDPTAVFNETYFYIEEYDKYFELKYPEKDQFVSDAQFESFFAQLKVYTKEMMDAFYNKNVEKLTDEVNINSLIDYLIIDQIMGERDHFSKSFNMYYTNTSSDAENGRLNFGPIWDYDWSLYTTWTGQPNSSYDVSDAVSYSNLFFQTMIEIPEFYEIVKDRYESYALPALEAYLEDFDDLAESIEESVDLNEDRWYSSYNEGISADNIDFLKRFLERRIAVLEEEWLS